MGATSAGPAARNAADRLSSTPPRSGRTGGSRCRESWPLSREANPRSSLGQPSPRPAIPPRPPCYDRQRHADERFRADPGLRSGRGSVARGGWSRPPRRAPAPRSEEHTSELQSHVNLVCRLLLEKKKKKKKRNSSKLNNKTTKN